MRPVRENDTVQVEVTSFCKFNCSNCTRFCGHYGGKRKHWFMDFETFKRAVDSLEGFKGAQGVGMMGGEPVFHPQFEKMAHYMAEKLGPENCGLWTCFPKEKKKYGPVIADCFGTVFLNDHSINEIIHCPFMVAIEEVVKDEMDMWYLVDRCWAQRSWSASINPLGAYFCEIAASMGALFNDPDAAWIVEPGWWQKNPMDYVDQIRKWCPKCGGAVPLQWRVSTEVIDDLSPKNLERLREIDSPKIRRGQFQIHDLVMIEEKRKMAAYKDENYRQKIAARYGLFLALNQRGFMVPFKKIVSPKAKVTVQAHAKG